MPDKFSAVWVSHTSISDFLKCPRAYYLKNIYKDPSTGHKMQLMTPAMALGQAVHEVLESLSVIPTDERLNVSLLERLDTAWKQISGQKGGFSDANHERTFRNRAEDMLRRVMANPGPVARLSIKIKEDLPYFWLSEEDNIILCGKIDWLEYLPESDSVHIIDFKTGKNNEEEGSLQLPIYHLLVANTQKRTVSKASYWYLNSDDDLTEKALPDLQQAYDEILQIAKKVKLARQLNVFKCPHGGDCFACADYEKILRGEATLVGPNSRRQDVYIIENNTTETFESEIL